jgi:signal peptidase II
MPTDVTPAGRDDASGNATPSARNVALYHVASHLRLWSVVILGLTADLWSKQWAFQTLRQGGRRVLIPYVLEFHTTLNPGALFGIGAGRTELFLIASVLALILVVWMFAQSPRRNWLTHIALGAILAGALGNMYDRAFVDLVGTAGPRGPVPPFYVESRSPDGQWILLQEFPPEEGHPLRRLPAAEADRLDAPAGYVRDFIKIPTRWFGDREMWPWVFNVADMLLVGGVGILAVRLLVDRKSRPADGDSELDAEAVKT